MISNKSIDKASDVESPTAFQWGMERIEGTSTDDIRAFTEEQNQ